MNIKNKKLKELNNNQREKLMKEDKKKVSRLIHM